MKKCTRQQWCNGDKGECQVVRVGVGGSGGCGQWSVQSVGGVGSIDQGFQWWQWGSGTKWQRQWRLMGGNDNCDDGARKRR